MPIVAPGARRRSGSFGEGAHGPLSSFGVIAGHLLGTLLPAVLLLAVALPAGFAEAGDETVERFAIGVPGSPRLALARRSLARAAEAAVTRGARPDRSSLRAVAMLESRAAVASLRREGIEPRAALGKVVSLGLDAAELDRLLSLEGVVAVRPAQPFRTLLDVNTVENGAAAARTLAAGGAGALVAVIDTGIDIAHPDFRDAAGQTRIRFLWDQLDDSWWSSSGTIGSPPPGGAPGDGTVYDSAQIDGALAGGGVVRSEDLVGHGTVVASAAAGNGRAGGDAAQEGRYAGPADEAGLLIVRIGGEEPDDIDLPGDVIGALAWIDARADELGLPVVVNMSFGTHLGPHDGTTLEELAIDEFVSRPGRVVVVAAGNEGNVNIHASGTTAGSHTLELFHAGESPTILVSCWLPGSDRVDLGFTDPAGQGVADLGLAADRCASTVRAPNRVTACVGGIDPLNGDRELLFLVERVSAVVPISAGRWLFHLRDEGAVVDGRFDCWSAEGQQFVADVDPSRRVSQPGTARGAVTVGASSVRVEWPSLAGPQSTAATAGALAAFSSPGPSRDGRLKPDLVTGGEYVVGAFSAGDGTGSGVAGIPPRADRIAPDGVHVAVRGTSLSAPQVAGAAALLLSQSPGLDAAGVRQALVASARGDEFTGTLPNDSWGFGKLDAEAALLFVPEATATPTSTPTPTPAATATPTPSAAAATSPTPIVSIPGDSNCDGIVDQADVGATWRALFDPHLACSADCNRNGRLEAADIACVVDLLAAP